MLLTRAQLHQGPSDPQTCEEWQSPPPDWGHGKDFIEELSDDNMCRMCPPQLSPLDVYSLKNVPLQRLLLLRSVKTVSLIQMAIISPASFFSVCNNPCLIVRLPIKIKPNIWGAEISLTKSPGHPTSAFLCVFLSVFYFLIIPSQVQVPGGHTGQSTEDVLLLTL